MNNCRETNISQKESHRTFVKIMEDLAARRDFFCGMIRNSKASYADPEDTAPQIVQMPLQDFIDSLSLLDALKSDHERWVEIHLDYPVYDSFTFQIFMHREEPDIVSEPERGEAGGVIDARPWH